MRWPAIQCVYKELVEASSDDAVSVLWHNILSLYFTVQKSYGMKVEVIPNRDRKLKKAAYFSIQYVRKDAPKTVIVVKNKRVNDENSDETWSDTTGQPLSYMLEARRAGHKPVYGIVTAGHYSKFYTLSPRQSMLFDFVSTCVEYIGQPLHLKDDEFRVHPLLEELLDLTSQ